MKKYLMLFAVAFTLLAVGCSKPDDEEEKNSQDEQTTTTTIKVALSVNEIADNQATISVSLESGTFYGAKLVEAVNRNTVSIDYTNEIKLISYVKENGVDIDLPYENTITGLRTDAEMFTAVIVFDENGLAVSSAYIEWTAAGLPEGWSEDNSAGSLGEIDW